ncbi:hypothetical protein QJS04_geneDACA000427 [Acorus gramineus]|uniref:Tripeptidyl-peptidase 2 n=1 Tax=Acorus gramineus TaxID=55184 RepID=A0AAV9ARE1_ACOGR|nr:hypothetical protein QJS04_geneDACA000427 [Acorus gramineus]
MASPPPPSSPSTASETSTVEGGGAVTGDGGDRIRSFNLNESTFLASLMPKKEIGADRFLQSHPEYDGRGALIAIFDSGVDPAAAGLQVTSDGKPKIVDIIDCTGCGDIDTSKVVKADADGNITGASGAQLVVNPSWKNPSGEWHVGYKLVYELFLKKPNSLTSRIKKERRKKWDEKNREAISKTLKQLNLFDKKYSRTDDIKLKHAREDLQNQLDFLKKQTDSYDDKGPFIDAVVWNDGAVWRVAIDTQSFEGDSKLGKLAEFVPLTNYRFERQYGIFSKLDACSFVTNVYNEGNLLSIVTDCSNHGTHVAGIAAAFHHKEPLLNGVAPGAQIISCKIGDGRLDCRSTGTSLTRALTAAVEHKCDLINMSYGGPTLLPNYGCIIDLVNEVVDKHRLVFVSSAGNDGPALSTVISPGGTCSSIIGVGAYVSPSMAAGAHCVVEPPSEGLEYTWSSRGPTVDGNLGVCVSAPGGAVAPVPTWTLQRHMLMNGTSMASPSACGGVALLISAMKAEGITVSPYMIRKALENTTISVGGLPEDKLSTGHGLMQVDRAFEYLQQSKHFPCICYKVQISQEGKSSPNLRGIYLREASACKQASEWTVQVEPKFHEDACNLEQLVQFEECIQLHSSEKSVVRTPEYLLLNNNGRSFNVIVDPTDLSDGLHYYEVYGTDCRAPWRGPIFRVPITIAKPMILKNQNSKISLSDIQFLPGHVERRFIEVPHGATWFEATMQTSGFDTARKFLINTVQICPLRKPIKWNKEVTFSSPSLKSFSFLVEGGLMMELAIAQFWLSGVGSHESTTVNFKIEFHGISILNDAVVLDGSEAPIRIDAKALISSEKLVPAAILTTMRIPYRPIESILSSLTTSRDKLPSGKQILSLTLIYKFKLEDGAEIKPRVPLLNHCNYNIQFHMISDSNMRVYATGDANSKYVKLPKGVYDLHLCIRHANVEILEKLNQLVLFIEMKLKDVIQLTFFSKPDGPIMGNSTFKSSELVPGQIEAFYVGQPTKMKLPKNCPPGSVLHGKITYGILSLGDSNQQRAPISYQISYVVPPPPKLEDEKGKDTSSSTQSVSEHLEDEVRDSKIKFLSNLKRSTQEECSTWKNLADSLKQEYPKYTPLLSKILEGFLTGGADEDNIDRYEEIINAAIDVVNSVDKDELLKYFSVKSDPEDIEAEKIRKKMEAMHDQLAEAFYQKGLALAKIESIKGSNIERSATASSDEVSDGKTEDSASHPSDQPDKFEENFKELKKWVDVKLLKYRMLVVVRERRCKRLGTALKVLNDKIQDDPEAPKKKLYELKIELLDEIGWTHLASYERRWMYVRFPPSLPPF